MLRRAVIAGTAFVVGLPVLVIAGALAVANTDRGRAWILEMVESGTAEAAVRVRVDRLSGTVPSRIRLEGLRLADRSGEFVAIDRLDLTWSPLALLGGTVVVDAVDLSGGRVARAPDMPADPAGRAEPAWVPSLAFPAPPLAVRIGGLRISDVELGEELVGRAAVAGADLRASVTATTATAEGWLTVTGDHRTARLDLDLAVVPSDGTLRAELRASEPEGGLVAGLLGLPGRPALDLTVTGKGTLADWRGRLAGGFGAGAEVDLALTAAASGSGTRIGADGTVALQRLLPEAAGPLAGPSTGLAGSALIAPDGAIAVERLAVRAAAASLEGTARIDPSGTPVEADATLRLPDLKMLAALAGAELAGAAQARLELRDDGRLARVAVTGAPVVQAVALTGLTAGLSVTADRPLAARPAEVAWSLDAALDSPAPAGTDLVTLLGPRVAMQASGSADTAGIRADRIAVTADAGRLDAVAGLSDDRRVTVLGTVAVADLGRLSALAGRPLAGSATLAFDGTVLLDPLDVAAVVDLAAAGLDPGDPALAALLGPAPGLGAGVTLDAAGRLSMHGLALQALAGRADGDAAIDLERGSVEGRIDLTAPDLAVAGRALGVDLAGSAAAAVALGGTLESPTASASWRASPLAAHGIRVAELTGSATAVGLPASPSGRLDLRADAGGEAVTLSSGYALAAGRLTLDGFRLDGAGLRARGGATVRLDGPSVEGELAATVSDLGRLGTVTGLPLSGGSADMRVTLDARSGQSARLSGVVTGLVLDGGAIEVAEIELSGEGSDLLGRPAGTLRAALGGVRRDGAPLLETVRMTADSDGSVARAGMSLKGGADRPVALEVTASAALDTVPMRASVDTLEARMADVRATLVRPTRITLGRQPRIEDLALQVDGGRITGGGRIDPADLDVVLAVRDLPAGLARLADPALKLEGGIDADLSMRGALGDPAARLTVSASALRSADPNLADLPALAATAEARVENRALTAAVDASVGAGAQVSLRASAGLSVGVGGAPPAIDDAAPLQARLDVEAALDQLSAFLPLDGGRIGGQGSVHLVVAGTPARPQVDGTATLRDGAVDQPRMGLYLRDLRLQASGQGERLVIETLTATAAGGGTLAGSGGISFDVADGAPADLRLEARRLRAVDTDTAEVTVDADLALQGALPEYRLAGTVTVLPSEIRIPDQLPASVVQLDVTEVRDGIVVRSPQPQSSGDADGHAPVALDVAVAIPGRVFIRGRGLDSEWGGELAVTDWLDAPQVDGVLAIRRGQFGLAGRNFDFRRGRVVFDGGPVDDPTLDMLLAADVADIVARVEVSGRAQDPAIALTSEPALPEEEVLSRVLFGSPRAQLSPLQALKLAQSAAVLSGRLGGGGGITDTVRETLGVDTLDLDTGDGGEDSRGASLSVGKYVAPGVFLKLQQSLSGAASRAVVEVELTDSITVETDVGADSQSRVGVNWKLDY